jgi:DTW domain-containing protein YfiP
MGGTSHLAPGVKRPRCEGEASAAEEGECPASAPPRTTDQPTFRIGAGVDDIADGARGPGTRYLVEHLLWGLRSDNFERMAMQGRKAVCRKCGGKKKYFCEKCTEIVGDASLVPTVHLPIDIAVIRDERENKSKSTATHAALTSPDINIFTYPELPAGVGDDEASVAENVLLFPSESSVEVGDLDWRGVKRVLLIDSTWITCNQMLRDPRLMRLRHIRIQDEQTTFWRYHHHGESCLSTIECIYHTLRQHRLATAGAYAGEYDGVLFYYAHFYRQIQLHYLRRPDRSFMHKSNYIHYDKAAHEARLLSVLQGGAGGAHWAEEAGGDGEEGVEEEGVEGDRDGGGKEDVEVEAIRVQATQMRKRSLQILAPSPTPVIVGVSALGTKVSSRNRVWVWVWVWGWVGA